MFQLAIALFFLFWAKNDAWTAMVLVDILVDHVGLTDSFMVVI